MKSKQKLQTEIAKLEREITRLNKLHADYIRLHRALDDWPAKIADLFRRVKRLARPDLPLAILAGSLLVAGCVTSDRETDPAIVSAKMVEDTSSRAVKRFRAYVARNPNATLEQKSLARNLDPAFDKDLALLKATRKAHEKIRSPQSAAAMYPPLESVQQAGRVAEMHLNNRTLPVAPGAPFAPAIQMPAVPRGVDLGALQEIRSSLAGMTSALGTVTNQLGELIRREGQILYITNETTRYVTNTVRLRPRGTNAPPPPIPVPGKSADADRP